MLTFFKINNVNVSIQHDALYDFAMSIAMSQITEDQVAQILKTIVFIY